MTAESAENSPPEVKREAEAGFRLPRWLWLSYALMLTAIAAVGATSFWMEAAREEVSAPLWPFVVDEATSVVTVFALTPLLLAWTRRLEPRRIGWPLALLGHVIGMISFSLFHITGMLLARFLAYPFFGGTYRLEDEPFLTRLLYEGRKDSLTYAALVIGAWILRALLDKRTRPAPIDAVSEAPARLELRDGAKRYWLETNDILWVEAAGNYVELHLADRSLLRRQTLAALERELDGRDFVRIHRSRLVNARHVSAAQTNESGDFTVTLTDGRQISGGRRWRSGLDKLTRR